MKDALVSIVIPTYNRAHLVLDALRSVLAQTYKNYEIILIDDGSMDDTESVIKPFSEGQSRFTYIRQENQGISAARNRGITEAKGEWVAFLDSDDIWFPEKLEKQLAYLAANPDVHFLCSRFRAYEISENSKERPSDDRMRYGPDDFSNKFEDLLMSKNFIPTSTVMVRRSCFEEVGMFDRSIPCYEDFDLWLRLANRYRYECLGEMLVEYREHPQNISKDNFKVHWGLWKLYVKLLELYGDKIPDRGLFIRRAAAFQYMAGSSLFKKGETAEGFKLIRGAFRQTLFFGTYFAKGNPLRGAAAVLKTWAVFVYAALKAGIGQKQAVKG